MKNTLPSIHDFISRDGILLVAHCDAVAGVECEEYSLGHIFDAIATRGSGFGDGVVQLVIIRYKHT